VRCIVVAFEDRNIVLTGFMGTGKSTVGRELAQALGFTWVDTDRLIEERHGPIPEIFDRSGEEVFRSIERNVSMELSTRSRHVFSTGGRMLLDPENIRSFSTSSRVFCLTADPETLVARLLRSPGPRPLLEAADPEARIRALLEERRVGYARFAAVETGRGSPEAVTRSLLETVTAETETPVGRRGFAVLGDAVTDLPRPVTVVTDETVSALHGPCLGPVEATLAGSPPTQSASVVYLGGTSITDRIPDRLQLPTVCAPTTPSAMERDHPPGVRTVVDLATLQTRGLLG
jgi:shikimate kinase